MAIYALLTTFPIKTNIQIKLPGIAANFMEFQVITVLAIVLRAKTCQNLYKVLPEITVT